MNVRTIKKLVFDRFLPLIAWIIDLFIWSGDSELRNHHSVSPWLIVGVSAALYPTLALRRRNPLAVFAVQLLWATTASICLTDFGPMAGLMVALYAVAARYESSWSTVAFASVIVPLAIQTQWRAGSLRDHLIGLVIEVLVVAAPWALGSHDRTAELREAEALRDERLRIARELHDIVAHSVSVMVLQAAGARAVLTTDARRAEAALEVIQEVGKQSTAELRRMLHLLRSSASDGASGTPGAQPGLDDLDTLLEKARDSGLAVSTQVEGTAGRLDPSVALTAYRVVQESITNTLKHAGPSASVRVHLAWESDRLAVTVEDHGARPARSDVATDKLSTGHGLLGLHERVTTVGGTLHTGPLANGFLVIATLPLADNTASQPSTGTLAHVHPAREHAHPTREDVPL